MIELVGNGEGHPLPETPVIRNAVTRATLPAPAAITIGDDGMRLE